MQTAAVFIDRATIRVDLPEPASELLPGVPWGAIEAFPSPAYWAYQVFAKRILGRSINYKLGTSLKEEVGACLLGGHGIPAEVGVAAYEHVRRLGAFGAEPPDEPQLQAWLSQPLNAGGRTVRYRFVRQKARYLAAALAALNTDVVPCHSGRALRDWLIQLPGIGYKTASWVARNWLRADDVAILDIHVLRAGKLAGVFPPQLTVERHYLELESRFLDFSRRLGVLPSELDAVIWLEMASSPNSMRDHLSAAKATSGRRRVLKKRSRAAADDAHADSDQAPLLV
jgi:N-glycosylase/DNA lyase